MPRLALIPLAAFVGGILIYDPLRRLAKRDA